MKNILVAQSGGPTAAINATLAGVITCAYSSGITGKVLGSCNGIQGVLEERFVDLRDKVQSAQEMDLLCQTPAAALGSCRLKLTEEQQYEQIVEVLRRNQINCFIYIGGNDSMDTVHKLSVYCSEHGIDDISVIGAPKTIDNDLMGTDHCPGFGSAAKYIAATFSELERDCHVYTMKAVTIVEVMGRNAGWLTAASALARSNGAKGPNLIYLCETDFDNSKFIADVKRELETCDSVVVAISEGIKDKDGRYVSEQVQSSVVDNFGHSYIAGSAKVLENLVRDEIGCKVRSIELNLMQRCAAHIASAVDIQESKMLGMKACQAALEGETGKMAAVIRKGDAPYTVTYETVPVSQVANAEKKVPADFITPDGHDVTDKMINYLKPLIQGENTVIYENGIPKHLALY